MTIPGEVGYEAYRQSSGGISLISGQRIPPFDQLPDNIKAGWAAAELATAQNFLDWLDSASVDEVLMTDNSELAATYLRRKQ